MAPRPAKISDEDAALDLFAAVPISRKWIHYILDIPLEKVYRLWHLYLSWASWNRRADLCFGAVRNFEFRDNRESPSTTMPWNIPSSVAVLWGVCWMFYGQSADPRFASNVTGELFEDQLWEAGPPAVYSSDPPLQGASYQLPPISSPLELASGGSVLGWESLLDYSGPILPQQFNIWRQDELSSSGYTYPLDGQVAGDEHSATSVAPDTVYGDSFGFPSTSNKPLPCPGLGVRPVASAPLASLDLFEPLTTIPTQDVAELPRTTQESNDAQAPVMIKTTPPPSMLVPVAEKALESSEFKCDQAGCGKTFKTATDIRKHRARHDLRFSCDTCVRRFGTRNDLDRHQSTVHSQGMSLWHCTATSCRRQGRGFSRRDNFKKHMRDVHGHTNVEDEPLSQRSSGPSADRKRKRDGDEVAGNSDGGRAESGLQLERENMELRDEIGVLRREREAEVQRHRDVEAEAARELAACREMQARLVGMLDKAWSCQFDAARKG